MGELQIRQVGYDHPDVGHLITLVQGEYVKRYGGPDESPIDPLDFRPPDGLFAVGYLDGNPVASGGWRRHPGDHPATGWASPAAELKRMFVLDGYRGAGFARAMLGYLEQEAALAGVRWLVLETGDQQPEAIALYHSSGYQPVPPFGHYADSPSSVHLGKELMLPAAADDTEPAG